MSEQVQFTFVNYKEGWYILLGEKQADCFYIIREGKVRTTKEVLVVGEKDEILGPGDLFGVVSTLSNRNHIETAQAITDVSLIAIPQHQYTALIQNNVPIAIKIIKQFSRQLRQLNETLASLTLKNTSEIDPSHLFDVAEYYYKQKQLSLAAYAYAQFINYCPSSSNIMTASKNITEIRSKIVVEKTDFKDQDMNRKYSKNTMLFAEGEPGEEVFILQKGSLKITKIVDNNEVMLAMLNPGDIVGEMALLEGKPRTACAIAYEDCSVMAINKKNFEMMIGTQPQLVARITILLAERIWFVYKKLINTLLDDPLCRLLDMLYIQLEKNRVPMNESSSYTFNIGPKELVNMVGLPEAEGIRVLNKIVKNKTVLIADGKIKIGSVKELVRQTEFYRRLDKIAKNKDQLNRSRTSPLGSIG